jgi:mRNA interferase MazF
VPKRDGVTSEPTTFRPPITIAGTETRVLIEQVTVVDPERLGAGAGRLSVTELRTIDHALGLILGL